MYFRTRKTITHNATQYIVRIVPASYVVINQISTDGETWKDISSIVDSSLRALAEQTARQLSMRTYSRRLNGHFLLSRHSVERGD